jgi:16S rRNA (cytosine1402-N4)-methyltransferase
VNTAREADLADILYQYGEERASRRIARAIVAARPLSTTLQLTRVVESCLPRPKPGQSHPATRSFQAIRIAVNDEFGELIAGMEASERALKPGGKLAVVTFHSLEDRVVKRFMAARSGGAGGRTATRPNRRSGAGLPTAHPPRGGAERGRDRRQPPRPLGAVAGGRTHRCARSPADRTVLGLPKLALEGH